MTDATAPTAGADRKRRVARWQGALVAALAAALGALVFGVPALLFLAVVALGFVLVGQVAGAPTNALELERRLEDDRVQPGESVRVTLSVTNEGETVVSDARIADSPPEQVPVTAGTPAVATAIRPGETVTHEYELTPPRGEFAFGPTTLRLRSVPATAVTTDRIEPEGETAFRCETLLDSIPLHDRTIQFVGPRPTDDGGSGVEFFSTREYRPGDPINRIDWHRLARTGELATVEYREERAMTVVFVVDDRDGVHLAQPCGGPDSYDLTLYAASRGVVASLEEGNRTGLATLSGAWVDPGAGSDTRRSAEAVIETDGGSLGLALEQRLPRRAQVVFCSPVSDQGAVELLETLRTRGRGVTVVSPDLTSGLTATERSPGARIARLERRGRLEDLRELGVTVVDWNLEDPLSIDVQRVVRSLSRRGDRL